MHRAVVLALLLVLTLPVAATATPPDGQPIPGGGYAAVGDVVVLTIDGAANGGFTNQSLDVMAAVAMQRDEAGARLDRYALDAAFQRASDDQSRRALLFEAATRVEISISALRSDERALRSAYANGTIDTSTFVRRVVRLSVRARALEADLVRIQSYADRVPRFSLGTRPRSLGAALIGFDGAVTGRAEAATRGRAPSTRIYAEVGPNGSVLATVVGGQYLREAYRDDTRTALSDSGFGLVEAVERAEQLYPAANNATLSANGFAGDAFQIVIPLPQGSIVTYVDSDTRAVFYEIQERRLDLLEPGPAVTSVENGTRLAVNRTYPSGPLRVAVSDNHTGDPVDATVIAGGTVLRTGDDGVVWTVAPQGRVRVVALGPGGNASLTARPLPARPVNG